MAIARTGALCLALVLAAPAGAATTDYTSFHVLGDSLSDAGNVYRAELRPDPGEPALLARPLLQRPGLGRPGGRRLPRRGPADRQPRLGRRQRRGRRPRRSRPRDAGGALPRARRGPGRRPAARGDLDRRQRHPRPRRPERRSRQGPRRGASGSATSRPACCAAGSRDFLILNLPDIGAIPKYGDDPADGRSATRGTKAFNRELDAQIASLRDEGARVRKVNVYGLFNDLLAHPRRYGVRNTTTPCLDEDDNPCWPPAGPSPRLLRRDPPEPGGSPAHRRGGDGQDRPARRHARRRRPRRRSAARVRGAARRRAARRSPASAPATSAAAVARAARRARSPRGSRARTRST